MVSVDHAPTDKGSVNLSKVTEDAAHQLHLAKFCPTIKIHYMLVTEKLEKHTITMFISNFGN